jgi:hypothetical protein
VAERVGNKSRIRSYRYTWENSEGKHSLYIKAAKVERVREMVYGERRSVGDLLKFLMASGKDDCTLSI